MASAKKTYEIGDEVLTHCNKCKSEMHHVITALSETDGSIRKVMCKGCETTHVYKDPKAKAPAARPRLNRVRTRKQNWNQLVEKVDEGELVDYDMMADYSDIAAINHTKFGVGIIRKVVSDKQIEVIFKDGSKILVQNYK